MKKLLTIALSLVMIFSMTAVSFADTTPTTNETVYKTYTVTGGTVLPNETLAFNVAAAEGNPDGTAITVDPIDVNTLTLNNGSATGALKINVPAYSKVGVYNYTISEIAGNSQGATYSSDSIGVAVYVTYDNNQNLKADVRLSSEGTGINNNDGKKDNFTNTYELGTLTITKNVTGNLGDKNKEFEVTVNFSSDKPVNNKISVNGAEDNSIIFADTDVDGTYTATKTISIKHNDTINFTNIPKGVTYTVSEADYTTGGKNSENGYDAPEYKLNNQIVTTVSDGISTAGETDTVVITNNKGVTIDTGIFFDNGIYIAILAIVLIAAAAFIIRRRQHRYDA